MKMNLPATILAVLALTTASGAAPGALAGRTAKLQPSTGQVVKTTSGVSRSGTTSGSVAPAPGRGGATGLSDTEEANAALIAAIEAEIDALVQEEQALTDELENYQLGSQISPVAVEERRAAVHHRLVTLQALRLALQVGA